MSDLFAAALAHQNAGRIDAAVASYRRLLAQAPAHGPARLGLALALLSQEKIEEAAQQIRGPLVGGSQDVRVNVLVHLGTEFQKRHRFAEAAECFQRALELRPDFAEALFNLGLARQNQGQLADAIEAYRRALGVRPDLSEPRQNLALLLQVLGRHAEAVEIYRGGITARPNDADFPRYLVAATFYDPTSNNRLRFDEAERYGARLRLAPGQGLPAYANSRDPERRLRIGYLTSDFRDHPIGRNMELLLAARDRDRFEIVVYGGIREPDATTARLRTLADAWRPTLGFDDAAVAEQIRRDGIDILVVLAGHFDHNRPQVAAYRPAPIQISFHDVTTSGSDGTFAYLIADRIVAPRRGDEKFTERVLRLPSVYAHGPIDAPPPGPLPCTRNGYVTFGSLNNPAKLNGSVLAVWAQILLGVPNSRLAFKYRNWFHAGDLKQRIISAFEVFGLGPERLQFLGAEHELADHLRVYDQIDIALDPFPFTGSTATYEALWMGAPVVTLAGPTMMARWSASILRTLRLDDLVTQTVEQYVAVAHHLAGDLQRLAALRAGLRDRIQRSPICNARLRARQVERVYRAVWRRWSKEPTAAVSIGALFEEAQREHRRGEASTAAALYRRVLAAVPDHAGAFHFLGVLDLQGGRYEPAADRLRHALALKPGDPAIQISLGHALRGLEKFAEAEAVFRAALAVVPFHGGAQLGLGEVLRAQGRTTEAIAAARKAVALEPGNGEACSLLGVSLQDVGQAADALVWLRKAIELEPGNAKLHYNLGIALQGADQVGEAIASYRQAIALDPRLGEAHNNLGLLLIAHDDPAAAAQHLELAAKLLPSQATVHNNLGKAFQHLGRVEEALTCFVKALELDAGLAEARVNAGAAQRALMRFGDAIATLRQAILVNPRVPEAFLNLGLTYRDIGELDHARNVLQRALELAPTLVEPHTAMAMVLNDLGLHEEARAHCRRALELRPDSAAARRSLLAVLVYSSGFSPEERFREHLRFGTLPRPQVMMDIAPGRASTPERRLRIGYVSSDLCQHPVGRNMRPIFAHHDRKAFEIFVYATTSASDAFTENFRSRTDTWRSVAGYSDRQLAAAVYADQVDILVHLAGRFDRNQPGVAAYRPAPVQVSFHDPATSGVDGMDYLIADPVLVPRDSRERFAERVVRLPSFYVHLPIDMTPEVGPLPARHSGAPVFGIFNNPAKLSDDSLALWAAVLRRIPRARILFKFRNRYRSETLRRRVLDKLGQGGVAEDRIEIIEVDAPGAPPLAIYNRVDLALDPHPFTGSTTTFEALWMGVPVLTLATETMVGRWSASILRAIKLDEFIADTPTAYVDTAVRLCTDLDRLAALRQELRARVIASELCDGRSRARQLERVYRAIWGRWCRSRSVGFLGQGD